MSYLPTYLGLRHESLALNLLKLMVGTFANNDIIIYNIILIPYTHIGR